MLNEFNEHFEVLKDLLEEVRQDQKKTLVQTTKTNGRVDTLEKQMAAAKVELEIVARAHHSEIVLKNAIILFISTAGVIVGLVLSYLALKK